MAGRRGFLIGLITLLFLLFFSGLYYKERTVFIDIAFHLFSIIKDNGFAIQNNRFAAFFTQLFPLIGVKLGLSLKTVAVLYSASFVVLPLLVFVLIARVLGNLRLGVAYLLFVVAMTTHTFYWIQSELPQGTALLFLYFALLERTLRRDTVPAWFLSASGIFLFFIAYAHPLLLFGFLFLMGFYYLNYPARKALLGNVLAIYMVIYAVKALFFRSAYDDAAMGGLANFIRLFPNYFTMQSNKNLVGYMEAHYYFIPLMLVAALALYLRRRWYAKAALLTAFFFGYTLLINVSYEQGSPQFYIENQYLLLGLITGIPFAWDVLPAIRRPQVQLAVLGGICLISLLRIWNMHRFYTARLHWERGIMERTAASPQPKVVIPQASLPKDTMVLSWGASYEFWLLSTLEQPHTRSIIVEETPGEFDWALGGNKYFITKWGTFDYNTLNPRYFHFADTSYYRKLP